jgi:ABC-type multidrug transport system ATPase subunit
MASSPGPTVETRALHKRYGSGPRLDGGALRDVSLRARPGVTVVMGANGAGKTTLLALCLGFLRPSSGSVALDGDAPARWLRARAAGYVPERVVAPDAWRVAPALRDLARLDRRAKGPADSDGAGVVGRFGLEAVADRRLGDLSRGELQRFALAQAALGDPALVVLDEPDQGLDADGRARLLAWGRELASAGATVLLSTHDPALAAAAADAVAVLAAGRLADAFDASDDARAPTAYRIALESPHAALGALARGGAPEASPAVAATPDEGAAAPGPEGASREEATLHAAVREAIVPVRDAAQLRDRLRTLLDAGARVVEVAPARTALEERIRASLGAAGGRT